MVCKKGPNNKAADALSRQQHQDHITAISFSRPKWLEIIVEAYQQDPVMKQLLVELYVTGSNDKGFSLHEGLIKYKGKIWLGNHKEAHQAIFAALHDSGLGGHSGMAATYNKLELSLLGLG